MKKPALTIALLCVSLAAVAQTSDIYKWVDADGNVHYGDRPDGVSNAPVEVVQIASSRTNAARVQAGIDARLEREEAREEARAVEAEAQEEAATAQADRDALRAQCANWRAQMEKVNYSRRLYKTDENGERIYMSDEQMAQTRAELQAKIDETCAGL